MLDYDENLLRRQRWDLGHLEIRPVVEMIEAFESPEVLFPSVPRKTFESYLDWLAPDYFCRDSNRLVLSVHGWLVKTRRHRILIDTCVGCDKSDGWRACWYRREDRAWLERLRAAGADPAQIDLVLCSHLHLDHCGWHTRWRDGRWQPTFANARYLFAREEFEALQRRPNSVFEENIRPVVASGQAQLVPMDYRVDEQIALLPLPGHTSGHVGILLQGSRGRAIMWGDLVHAPVQLLEPDWPCAYDDDPALACTTRRQFLQAYADDGTLMLSAHFPPPAAGIVGTRSGFDFRRRDDH